MSIYKNGNLWVSNQVGELTAADVTIMKVLYHPGSTDDDVLITDGGDKLVVPMKAGNSDTSPVMLDFAAMGGLRRTGMKIGTIDGGTIYIYVRDFG